MWSMVGLVVLANLVLLGVLGLGLRRSGGVASIFQRGVRGPSPAPAAGPLRAQRSTAAWPSSRSEPSLRACARCWARARVVTCMCLMYDSLRDALSPALKVPMVSARGCV
jgi:hypothetical protein